MGERQFKVDSFKPFSKSHFWQLNRDYYQDRGISAWSEDQVPHNMTSNSKTGKTYAELILAFLKDLSFKGQTVETVYIIELGAGHGRMAFHVLRHLKKLIQFVNNPLPPFCYVISDIGEDNLDFFKNHPQFKEYLESGELDLCYFDAATTKELHLRNTDKKIKAGDLRQPIIAIANYFFDSIPNDLFLVRDEVVSSYTVALQSKVDPKAVQTKELIENLEFIYQREPLKKAYYSDPICNEILEEYKTLLSDTHLFFPIVGIQCLDNLRNISSQGLVVITMDKGFHEIKDLDNQGQPDVVTHNSLSLWVNYHGLDSYCKKAGGLSLFPSFSTFHLNVGCLFFLQEPKTYYEMISAYQHFVNDFGPDDLNSIKKLAYANKTTLSTIDLIALYRISAYDSTFFIKSLPRLKELVASISKQERRRLGQTLREVLDMYFNINESYDLAYETGGLLFDLGYYEDAIFHFQYSENIFGKKVDVCFNKIQCYYQLRQDQLFHKALKEAKILFPNEPVLGKLDTLDMDAK